MGRVIYEYEPQKPPVFFKKNGEYVKYTEPGVFVNNHEEDQAPEDQFKVISDRSYEPIYKDPITYIISRYAKYGPDLFSLMTEEEVRTYQTICYNQTYMNNQNNESKSANASLFK